MLLNLRLPQMIHQVMLFMMMNCFSKTVQIDKNAGNDEVAESNDAIDVEFTLPIEDNKADQSHACIVATLAIESSIPTDANKENQNHACQDAVGNNSN
jgi:hypothetical protein